MDPVRVFLAGMVAGGALALLIIRAEIWWNERRK